MGMRKFATRAVIAASALTVAGLGVLSVGAGSAMASPNPTNTTISVTSQAQADALPGTVNKNIDVPATAAPGIWISWRTIHGNVTVEGTATMASDLVQGNVTVSGLGSFLAWTNQANHVTGNLTVTGSSGVYQGGPGTMSFGNWTQYPGADLVNAASQVDGNFSFTGNTGGLYSGYPMTVNGNLVYSSPGAPVLDRGGMTVLGNQYIS
jgi:hypothetical protein